MSNESYPRQILALESTDLHSELLGLSGDDHPQYLREDGTRPLSGDQSAGGFKLTNVADGVAANDAVNRQQLDVVADEAAAAAAAAALSGGGGGGDQVREFYIPGSARTYSRPLVMPSASVRIKRAHVYADAAPSGASGANHFKLSVTDGTTTFEVLFDSDVNTFENTSLESTSLHYQLGADTSQSATNEYNAVLVTVSATQTIDRVGVSLQGTSGTVNADVEFFVLDSALGVLSTSGEKALVGITSGGFNWYNIDLNNEVELTSGQQYWIGYRQIAGGAIDHETASVTGATGITSLDDSQDGAGPYDSFPQGASVGPRMQLIDVTYPRLRGPVTASLVEVGTAPAAPGGDFYTTLVMENSI